MQVVLLAGGFGTRIPEESVYKPKPLIEIGGMPIIWHIMKEYSYYGFKDFIICAGYKQEMIKEWFANYFINSCDVMFDYRNGKSDVTVLAQHSEPWKVTVVDTGLKTMTGGRIRRVREYIEGDSFFMTYGDGVCDVDINELLKFHKEHGKLATITAVKQKQEKGIIDVDGDNAVKSFREKNIVDSALVNAGYMVLSTGIFDYIEGDRTVFEKGTLEALASRNELMSYIHNGFWQCMDNIREKSMLETMLAKGRAPWKKWVD